MNEQEKLSMEQRGANIRGGVAFFSALIACLVAAVLWRLIATPFLGDGVHRVRWFDYLLLLPAAAFFLLAIVSLRFPRLQDMTPVVTTSMICLLPAIGMGFAIHFLVGLVVMAALVLPWLFLYSLLRHSIRLCSPEEPNKLPQTTRAFGPRV